MVFDDDTNTPPVTDGDTPAPVAPADDAPATDGDTPATDDAPASDGAETKEEGESTEV